jgi:hypothetical protein
LFLAAVATLLAFTFGNANPLQRQIILTLAALAGGAIATDALFATLHDDRRPPTERTASGRYLQPGLFEKQAAQTRASRL